MIDLYCAECDTKMERARVKRPRPDGREISTEKTYCPECGLPEEETDVESDGTTEVSAPGPR